MAWDDWVFGVATLGLYNVGKSVYKASKAAEEAGDAVEEFAEGAGAALADLGSALTKLFKDTSSFVKELEELLTINRLTPRDEDDLWDEEVERLNKLRDRESELLAELEALGASDEDHSWTDSWWDIFFGDFSRAMEELKIRTKLAIVRSAISEILYEEPGVIPTSIYHIQQILERFHTLHQPRIEEIMDGVNDNLEQSEEILKEVKKLFVIKTWREIPFQEIPEDKRLELERLQSSLAHIDSLIEKNTAISAQLQEALVLSQPESLQMQKWIGTQAGTSAGTEGGNPGNPVSRPEFHSMMATGPSISIKGKASKMAMQPIAAAVATQLNQNAVSGYFNNFLAVQGKNRFYLRERLKIEKAIYRIKWVFVEEPGVIPLTLEEIKKIIVRFRTEAQPRVETLLDNVNAAVVESKSLLARLSAIMESIQSSFDFLKQYSRYVKIGAVTGAVLILLVLFMTFIVLLRLAFVL